MLQWRSYSFAKRNILRKKNSKKKSGGDVDWSASRVTGSPRKAQGKEGRGIRDKIDFRRVLYHWPSITTGQKPKDGKGGEG